MTNIDCDAFVLDTSTLPRFCRETLHRPRDRAIYNPPLLLVRETIPANPLRSCHQSCGKRKWRILPVGNNRPLGRRPQEECAMEKTTRKGQANRGKKIAAALAAPLAFVRPGSLSELIHEQIRRAIEEAVEAELEVALGAPRYERDGSRRGYRNGHRERTLSGPTGPAELTLPRGILFESASGAEGPTREWQSKRVPRYERRMEEVNEAIVATYLSGGNTRQIKGALQPLLKNAPLSRSVVSRVVSTIRTDFDDWRKESLAELNVPYLYLDAIALRIRSGRKVTSLPVLAAVAVLADGTKRLLSLESCGSESSEAWKGFLEQMAERGLRCPVLCVIDGNPGLSKAVGLVFRQSKVQRCTVHKLRNIERKVPKHALEEVKADYHRIVYAKSEAKAREAYAAFERKWAKDCPGAVASLQEGGDDLLTFFSFPKAQWKTLRTTNVIERLNEEFRRRVKTQCSFPGEKAATALLFALVASGRIKLRRIDGWKTLGDVISMSKHDTHSQRTSEAVA
jgi:putative transposase